MISPTGKGIRIDSEGSGEYGASRGIRIHNGIDYLCDQGQGVRAPFGMFIKRIANPKSNSPLSGIEWTAGRSSGKMFYFKPYKQTIGQEVVEGEIIGIAQSVSKDYGLPNMLDHIHFQVDK
jgi:hypothetical protein